MRTAKVLEEIFAFVASNLTLELKVPLVPGPVEVAGNINIPAPAIVPVRVVVDCEVRVGAEFIVRVP